VTFPSIHPRSLLFLALVALWSCGHHMEDQMRLELRRSFQNYIDSVEAVHDEGLKHYVFFPETTDYAEHVRKLLLTYLEDAQEKQQVSFDEQGVVLCRFLGLDYHRFVILSVSSSNDDLERSMRIAISFDYDGNLSAAQYEPGTTVLIPSKPWGKVAVVRIGGENDLPREQLAYIEVDLDFNRTNFEGYWQLRRCVADENSARYELSFKADF